jgi:hypothetical protein
MNANDFPVSNCKDSSFTTQSFIQAYENRLKRYHNKQGLIPSSTNNIKFFNEENTCFETIKFDELLHYSAIFHENTKQIWDRHINSKHPSVDFGVLMGFGLNMNLEKTTSKNTYCLAPVIGCLYRDEKIGISALNIDIFVKRILMNFMFTDSEIIETRRKRISLFFNHLTDDKLLSKILYNREITKQCCPITMYNLIYQKKKEDEIDKFHQTSEYYIIMHYLCIRVESDVFFKAQSMYIPLPIEYIITQPKIDTTLRDYKDPFSGAIIKDAFVHDRNINGIYKLTEHPGILSNKSKVSKENTHEEQHTGMFVYAVPLNGLTDNIYNVSKDICNYLETHVVQENRKKNDSKFPEFYDTLHELDVSRCFVHELDVSRCFVPKILM